MAQSQYSDASSCSLSLLLKLWLAVETEFVVAAEDDACQFAETVAAAAGAAFAC